MSAEPATAPAAVGPSAGSAAWTDFGLAVRAEWTKFRTVRSSTWTLLASAGLTVGTGAAFAPLVADTYDGPAAQATATAIREGWWFQGLHLGIFAVLILGVLVATAEYSSGTIRATLTAVPSRMRVLAAKATAFAAVTLVAGAVQAYAAFLAARPLLTSKGVEVSAVDPGALGGVAMAALGVMSYGQFGLGAGLLIRHSAAAIGSLVGVLLVVPGLTALLPASWDTAVKLYPANAMSAMFTPHTGTLTPGPATAVFFGYVAAMLALAGWLFARRDA